jgi:hypothetical protein
VNESFDPALVREWTDAQADLAYRLSKISQSYPAGEPVWNQAVYALRYLLGRYQPFANGDIVRITRKITCEGGWEGFDEVLAEGQLCEAHNVRVWDGRWVVTAMPLEQWEVVYEPNGYSDSGFRTLRGMPSRLYARRRCFMLDERSVELAIPRDEWAASVRRGRSIEDGKVVRADRRAA